MSGKKKTKTDYDDGGGVVECDDDDAYDSRAPKIGNLMMNTHSDGVGNNHSCT
jgi:hypothetical protein